MERRWSLGRFGGAGWAWIGLFAVLAAPPAQADCGPVDEESRTSHRLLRWEDFRVPRRFEAGAGEARARAEIALSVALDAWEPRVSDAGEGALVARPSALCVRAYMHKQRSARASQRQRGDLAHEQGHFDVAQLFAHVLHERLAEIEVRVAGDADPRTALLPEIRAVYRATLNEHQAMQDRYEDETAFGNQRGPQARWKRELAARLARHEARAKGEVALLAASQAR